MAIITLTTDFGLKDYSVGIIKGSILSDFSEAQIIDITHEIEPFNLIETAFIISNSFRSFPKGTVHIIAVDALVHPHIKAIAAEIDGHFFVCNDNGILSLILQELKPKNIVEVTIKKYEEISFLVKELFVPVACHLARGGMLEVIGRKTNQLLELSQLKPSIGENTITGTIVYIDNFGNAISNISHKLFKEIGKTKAFTVNARNYNFSIIHNNYVDIVHDFDEEIKYHGEKIALFNCHDFLEIALYKSNKNTVGSATSLLGLGIGERISVTFH